MMNESLNEYFSLSVTVSIILCHSGTRVVLRERRPDRARCIYNIWKGCMVKELKTKVKE